MGLVQEAQSIKKVCRRWRGWKLDWEDSQKLTALNGVLKNSRKVMASWRSDRNEFLARKGTLRPLYLYKGGIP